MIEIKRRLDAGIYRSSGGGEVRTLYSWSTRPRNLVAACKKLPEVQDAAKAAYGNIGCGYSWIEIDGNQLDPNEVLDINHTRESRREERSWSVCLPTATQYAARLIAQIQKEEAA